MHPSRQLRFLRPAAAAGLVALAYFAAAELGYGTALASPGITLVWPPTGVALAALVLLGRRFWPAVAVADLAAHLLAGTALAPALGVATGNTLEAIVGVTLLRRAGFDRDLLRVRDVLALVAAAIASTAVSASLGALSLTLAGVAGWDTLAVSVYRWWLGDLTGDLVVAPLILVWAQWPGRVSRRRLLEAVVLGLTACGALGLVLLGAVPVAELQRPHAVFPVLMWATLRFGQRGATAVAALAATLSMWAIARGIGPFATEVGPVQLMVFLGAVALAGLLLGAALAERARAVAALQEEHRRKDEFLAVLGHELRNPLAPIRNAVELLRLRDDDPAARAGARAVIDRQVRHMVRLVDDLLDVGRITRGAIELRRERVQLGALVAAAIETARPTAEALGQRLEVEVVDPEVTLDADPARLAQALNNLLDNASKYTPAGGHIWVRAGRSGDQAVVSVRDTGAGMTPDVLARVFDLFVRGVRPRDAGPGGLGIGLSLARQLAVLHGGDVTASSAGPGRGSEVTLRVPALPAAALTGSGSAP